MSEPVPTKETPTIELEYRLADLPTAQHKAGLAGLLLFIRYLEERDIRPRPVISRLDRYSAALGFDEFDFSRLFEEHYAGYQTESRYRSKLQNKKELRVDEIVRDVDGKQKSEKWYVYEDFRPTGGLFAYLLQGGADSPWLKLWQDMLWAVLRAQPKTREDFKRSAYGEPVSVPTRLWPKLVKACGQKPESKPLTDSIAGSIFVGAQDKNAERVDFVGRVEQNLLLHFWPLVAPVFVPQIVDIKNRRRASQGYLLAIPEVADLVAFFEAAWDFWRSLSPETSGFRPAGSLIDIPEEAGLEFLYQLSQQRVVKGQPEFADELLAIEWYHQEKQGNNVRMHAYGRLASDRRMLREYERLRGHKGNPLFKWLLIRNLVDGCLWFTGAQALFGAYPSEFFIQSPKSPRFRPFGQDAWHYFQDRIIHSLKLQEKQAMTEEPDRNSVLAQRIYRLIGAYVEHRTDERAKIKRATLPKDEEGHTLYTKDYREAREKVAKDAFLAMRGRNGRDFIEYFTGTICSVPQYFGGGDEFVEISLALIDKTETIKDLSMLALSAWSWLPNPKNEAEDNQSKDEE